MRIVIYGAGCARCAQTEQHIRRALAERRSDADVVKVSDPLELAAAGILRLPTVTVDGITKSAGRIPTVTEVQEWCAPDA